MALKESAKYPGWSVPQGKGETRVNMETGEVVSRRQFDAKVGPLKDTGLTREALAKRNKEAKKQGGTPTQLGQKFRGYEFDTDEQDPLDLYAYIKQHIPHGNMVTVKAYGQWYPGEPERWITVLPMTDVSALRPERIARYLDVGGSAKIAIIWRPIKASRP